MPICAYVSRAPAYGLGQSHGKASDMPMKRVREDAKKASIPSLAHPFPILTYVCPIRANAYVRAYRDVRVSIRLMRAPLRVSRAHTTRVGGHAPAPTRDDV